MTFEEIYDQVLAMLQHRGRVSYGALKRQFALDEAYFEDLKEAILFAHPQVIDEAGRGLIWIHDPDPIPPAASPATPEPVDQSVALDPHSGQAPVAVPESQTPEGERRQLTVLFCDLVDSTTLASQLDPEELREVVLAYQEACAKVTARFEGHIAQYLGDGVLVYFGYPLAHEDDAQRAVRAGLGIVEALGQLNTRLVTEHHVQLAVRLGIHTGLVVVGSVGEGHRQEQLALGETPNLAARLQGLAKQNTLVISAPTFQLLGGFFACQSLGTPLLKGVAQPMEIYQVLYESTARSRLDAARSTGLTTLVGRDREVRLLQERWEQAVDGIGQVVLLSGEAGIGKSRLVEALKVHVATELQAWLTPCQCSPYYQHSALYPMIDLLERVALRFDRQESTQQRFRKLEGYLVQYGLPLREAVPLMATLLSLPLSADYVPLQMSAEQQKQNTLQTLLTILLRRAAQQPVLFIMEDLHWVDPSTLELLNLLVDHCSTSRMLVLLTFRPDFNPPWTARSHLTKAVLHRLTHRQATEMAGWVAGGKSLPTEVMEQVVSRTDGVPLFVEELTKMVLESGLLHEGLDGYDLTGPLPLLAIPTTLHDSLMARLDRLGPVKSLAQLGATLGREFSYALLMAISPLDEGSLRRGLQKLVDAEFVYQQGLPPQATYVFKHALIQQAAYQSLLRSTRQRHHQRIAQALETSSPEVCESQPELLAHHYTEAGLKGQAINYWQRAGQRAVNRSAYAEAIGHLTKELVLVKTLPESAERIQHELAVQTTLGQALIATKGYAAPEVEQTYARARDLCQLIGETPQLFPVLRGLWLVYFVGGKLRTAHELGEQLLTLAQTVQDSASLLEAHRAMGTTLFWLGKFDQARFHLEEGATLYDSRQHSSLPLLYGQDPRVTCLGYLAWALWLLGYPDKALDASSSALALAQTLSHPFSLAFALQWAAELHKLRREAQLTQVRADAVIAISREQGFAQRLAEATGLRGWALGEAGPREEGIIEMQRGLAAMRAIGAEVGRPHYLARLAETYAKDGQAQEGLHVLAEGLAIVSNTEVRWWEAEMYRLKGELLLALSPEQEAESEACLQHALDVARRQQAKSLELRAAMSLSRLWQRQGTRDKAHHLLAEVYEWFTEGFDTADLQEAKTLLAALS